MNPLESSLALADSRRVAPDRLAPRTAAGLVEPAILSATQDGAQAFLVGHERAARAIDYALAVDQPGYHLFVMGPKGIGKTQFVRDAITRSSPLGVPHDWVYLHNFASDDKPCAFSLNAGDGTRFREAMRALVRELEVTLPAAFDAESYATEVQRVQTEISDAQNAALQAVSEEAMASGIALLQTPEGLSFAPVKDGEVMPAEAFGALPVNEQETIRARISELEESLQKAVRHGLRERRAQATRIQKINTDTARFASEQAIDDLRESFKEYPALCEWIDALQADLLEHYPVFLPAKENAERAPGSTALDPGRYEVNLLTEARDGEVPIVGVDHPTMAELVGRIEFRAQMGALYTDFRLIKPGRLHEANGGYLLVDAWRLLAEPFAWDALKRALQRAAIRIESVAEANGGMSAGRLEPEPIPLSVKVIMFGERYMYHMLGEHDPDFEALFRVVADFDDALPRDDEHQLGLARVIAAQAAKLSLLPFSADGLARVLDEAARLADDNTRLSAHVQSLMELAVEANAHARRADQASISAKNVRDGARSRRERMARSHHEYQQSIARGVLLIDTDGACVGQVNGLAVYDIAGHGFGNPSRITATTRIGDGNVLDIQRETHMAGSIHTKGVMILSSYLSSRFAARSPLPVNATLNFEQSYGPIDGDSATIAEVCALLSSLSRVPLRQDIAVTGSMNQLGQVQAVGGVNHKIEGFFDICLARGLTGTQGVIIPASNVEHLMLDDSVVEAVEAGRFHIYAIHHVDEALSILLGLPIGEPNDGPQADTVTSRLQQRLGDFLSHRNIDRISARKARLTSGDRGM